MESITLAKPKINKFTYVCAGERAAARRSRPTTLQKRYRYRRACAQNTPAAALACWWASRSSPVRKTFQFLMSSSTSTAFNSPLLTSLKNYLSLLSKQFLAYYTMLARRIGIRVYFKFSFSLLLHVVLRSMPRHPK